MPIIPSGYANVAVPFTLAGFARSAFITFGVADAGPAANPDALATAIQVTVDDNIAPVLDSTVTVGPVHVDLNVGAGPVPGEADHSALGQSSDDKSTANVALLVRKRTIESGRTNRGRLYLPWVISDDATTESGSISSGTVSDFQDVMDQWLADLSAADAPMYILHTGVGSPTPVTSLQVDLRVATQRRRLDR